uniref:Uncharacterized protein n=1 Tax=Zonotrichia albicollis TaxID=44394 RepID=A0A8D2LZI8_ZONAL
MRCPSRCGQRGAGRCSHPSPPCPTRAPAAASFCHQLPATGRWRVPRAGWCPQSQLVSPMMAAWTAPTPSLSTLAMVWSSRTSAWQKGRR